MEKSSMVWRLFHLLPTIQQSPGLSSATLAERCEMSERTIYRYIKMLRMAGSPIITERGYRMNQQTSLCGINLTLTEALAVILAGQHLGRGKAPFSEALKSAEEKILSALPESVRQSVSERGGHALMGKPGPIDYSKYGSMFNLVDAAVEESAVISIEYFGLDGGKSSARLVDPYGTVFSQGFWYLVAHCHKRGEKLLFRLDRITGLVKTGDNFKPTPDFTLEEYMKDAWRVIRGAPQQIRVRFSGTATRIVTEAKWHPSQNILLVKNGEALVEFQIGGLKEIASWLLGFGGEAEVIEPLELRKMVAETARAAAGKNS